MSRTGKAAALLALLAQALAGAQALQDKRAEIRVGVCRFLAEGRDAFIESLADTIPLRLRDGLAGEARRSLSPEEASAYREWARASVLYEEGGKLREQSLSYARSFLTEAEARKLASARASAQAQMRASRQTIEAAEKAAASSIGVAQRKPIVVVDDGKGGLLEAVSRRPVRAAAMADLDIIVGGRVSALEDYLVIELWAYHRFLDEVIVDWKTAAARDDIGAALAEALLTLRPALTGKAEARLAVIVDPAEAELYLDGTYAGRGSLAAEWIEAGTHQVRAEAPGHASVQEEISLSAGETRELRISLEKKDRGTFRVASLPEGAAVYLGAEYLGASPVDIDYPDRLVSGRLRAPGMQDALFVAGPDAPADVKIELIEAAAEGGSALDRARKAFYDANAKLMISLPLTILASGLFISDVSALSAAEAGYQTGTYSQEQYQSARKGLMLDMAASGPFLLVSAGFSTWFMGECLFRLARYLDAARE